MLIRFLKAPGGRVAGAASDAPIRRGHIVDLPAEEAAKWADGVRAELVADEPAASAPAPEIEPLPAPAGEAAPPAPEELADEPPDLEKPAEQSHPQKPKKKGKR